MYSFNNTPIIYVSTLLAVLLLTTITIVTSNIPAVYCSGPCDTEEFKPTDYWYYRCYPTEENTDC